MNTDWFAVLMSLAVATNLFIIGFFAGTWSCSVKDVATTPTPTPNVGTEVKADSSPSESVEEVILGAHQKRALVNKNYDQFLEEWGRMKEYLSDGGFGEIHVFVFTTNGEDNRSMYFYETPTMKRS